MPAMPWVIATLIEDSVGAASLWQSATAGRLWRVLAQVDLDIMIASDSLILAAAKGIQIFPIEMC
jgi:hypothetical protein